MGDGMMLEVTTPGTVEDRHAANERAWLMLGDKREPRQELPFDFQRMPDGHICIIYIFNTFLEQLETAI